MEANITVLPGDGIGPEVTTIAVKVLEKVEGLFNHRFHFEEKWIGGQAIDQTGASLPEETLTSCLNADAVLLGAVGDPKFDDPTNKVRPEQGLLELRKALNVFCNLRPISVYPALFDFAPLKSAFLQDVNFIIVRELTGGIYFGQPRQTIEINGYTQAVDTMVYSEHEIERIARIAFDAARQRRNKVTLIDKANVLDTSRLWRRITARVAKTFPDVELKYMLVDAAAMKIISNPSEFDVILTENMFGDILSDEASVLSGSMGLLPSASIGISGPGIFEPIHGSAPDIAGRHIANPIGSVLSSAMLLRYGLSLEEEANAVENAVHYVIENGALTPDLGGSESTGSVGEQIIKNI